MPTDGCTMAMAMGLETLAAAVEQTPLCSEMVYAMKPPTLKLASLMEGIVVWKKSQKIYVAIVHAK